MKRYWLDTEFNEFGGELISVGIVCEDGREFYVNLGCESPRPWVAQHVMPQIAGEPVVSPQEARARLAAFLGHNDALVYADWPCDLRHFCDLLITGPGMRFATGRICMELIDPDYRTVHHALKDARLLRAAHSQS